MPPTYRSGSIPMVRLESCAWSAAIRSIAERGEHERDEAAQDRLRRRGGSGLGPAVQHHLARRRETRRLSTSSCSTVSLVLALLWGSATILAAQDSMAAPPPPGRLVDIGGRRLHIHCSGSGSPTVITESGSSSFSIEWALVQDRVSSFTRICSYDRAGFAWSDRGPAENTVEETMDDLHRLLRAAGVAPPYLLVGHSIGGMYVRAYQRRYPEQVVGLVLVDATPEEDLEYSYNGKSTPGVQLTYDQLAAAYAPYIKNPPPPLALPIAVDTPYNRLSPALQRAEVWAERLWRSRIDMPHSWISAESWRQEFVALLQLRRATPHALGDLPLI